VSQLEVVSFREAEWEAAEELLGAEGAVAALPNRRSDFRESIFG